MRKITECFYLQTRFDVGRELLKWLAVIAMTIDHIGAILYPEHHCLRIIGRLAFPIFCYLIVLGVESTRSVRRYLSRLFIFALISQLPYAVAFRYKLFESLNVLFILSLEVIFLQNPLLAFLLILVTAFPMILGLGFNLSWGIAYIPCMFFLKDDTRLGVLSILFLNIVFLLQSDIQAFSVFALPLILLHRSGYLKIEREVRGDTVYPSWRKYFFYVYYPLHLTVLHLFKRYF